MINLQDDSCAPL